MDVKNRTKTAAISALHCLSPTCDGLLAYEVDADNRLHIDLSWTARRHGDELYFPCPKCGGKNLLAAELDGAGARKLRVARWEP